MTGEDLLRKLSALPVDTLKSAKVIIIVGNDFGREIEIDDLYLDESRPKAIVLEQRIYI